MSIAAADELLASDFSTMPDLIRSQAAHRPHHIALIDGERMLTSGSLVRPLRAYTIRHTTYNTQHTTC